MQNIKEIRTQLQEMPEEMWRVDSIWAVDITRGSVIHTVTVSRGTLLLPPT